MGSCFAVEIRRALRAEGFAVYPDYPSMAFDPTAQIVGRLPERDNINHYDTFTIRQEIERAVKAQRWQAEHFWSVSRCPFPQAKSWERAFQDPYRRHIYANSMAAVVDLSTMLSERIDAGLAAADVVIITLGLTEVWRVKATGMYAALGPVDERDEIFPYVEFEASGFAENHANLRATLAAMWSAYPDKKVVLTVSPVALGRTWTGEDVVRANLHSKSTLRAVAGQICREHPQVTYWPSYEFAMSGDVFREDGKHVRADVVDEIVRAFIEAHSAPASGGVRQDDRRGRGAAEDQVGGLLGDHHHRGV